MRILISALLITLSTVAFAASSAQRISDAELNDSIELGDEIEARADDDLNNDGADNVAYVVGSDKKSYVEKFEQNNTWVSNPTYMEDAPDPETLMITLRKK